MQPTVTVFPLPPRLPFDPYLDHLYGAMTEPRVRIRRSGRARSALLRLLTPHGARVWHLHFFDEVTQRRGRAAARLRTWGFVTLLRAASFTGAHIVWTVHNLEPHELWHADLATRTYQEVLKRADAVIVHSRAAAAAFEARYGRIARLEVIPHGAPRPVANAPYARDVSRRRLGWPETACIVLGLGTLRRYKGFEDLIAAFAAVSRGHDRLVIAGRVADEAYAEELERLCSAVPGASFQPGFVADEDLPRLLSAADLVALPYRRVLTSGMLMWPLSYAVPVLAPAFPTVEELLVDGKSGFLYRPGDATGLRDALARALAHPERGAIGRAGRDALGPREWSETAARTASVYLRVAFARTGGSDAE